MGEDKDGIRVGRRSFGMNTEIRINVKTLLVFLGIAVPGITGLYYKLDGSIESTKKDIQERMKPLEDKVNTLNEKIIVIGINVENAGKAQENVQKNIDRLINKLIPESRPNSTIRVEDTDPDDITIGR